MWGDGAGSRLPIAVLALAGISTLFAVAISATGIFLQLKNYRKPYLQRMVVRIMVMVPIYAISSFISLFSLEAAFFIDAVRDIYEAYVIYCFFVLLLSYLGGERSLLILLHGRPPKDPPFPINLFKREIDVSDPYTFLFLKRGILQYVQVKPILAVVTMILKACGKFNEGDLRAKSGYLYVSIVYNISICLSLYCLAMFWLCVNDDLKPFRPVPKFLCVKGILFFSFWQSIAISIIVAAGAIKHLGPYTDSESISLGLTDTLICVEMPFFAVAHMFAFSHTDFIDRDKTYIGRMPISYAFRDAFGVKDVIEDTKATLRGEGMDYREFEPSEGFMHQGLGRERRIRAGLRYSKGGKGKYWLPSLNAAEPPGQIERGINRAVQKVAGRDQGEDVHAPLLQAEEEDVVHLAPDMVDGRDELVDLWSSSRVGEEGFELPFGDLNEEDEELYAHCKRYLFGDYNYPCIDASTEFARAAMWDEEERILRDEHGAWFSPIRGSKGLVSINQRHASGNYGAVGTTYDRGGSSREVPFDNEREERVLDMELETEERKIPGAVKMQWAKHRANQKSPSVSKSELTHSQSPHVRARVERAATPGRASSSGSTPAGSPGAAQAMRSPPDPISRKNSSTPHNPPLPPDAVDLVVEAKDNNDSKKGHSLRKVYRRGFVARDDLGRPEERGELELEGDGVGDEERVEAGEEIAERIEDEREPIDSAVEHVVLGGQGVNLETEVPDRETLTGVGIEGDTSDVVVARATTPPVYAMPRSELDDGNPWA
ncbi:organic solute transporter Ostalpha-domain-containing protein [Rhodocollybia butyracea]|uniref:Organic solute transporter Ostalpha-domain-containing protein n=1 Tax=Rhodocollybia butyracea TaxID=206335 RepID=A0A9P5PU23_9AGAR|nr:organic solute transporter Ostalpha-domain-containing protein [Rhodocollybia butyracea]